MMDAHFWLAGWWLLWLGNMRWQGTHSTFHDMCMLGTVQLQIRAQALLLLVRRWGCNLYCVLRACFKGSRQH